MMRTSQHDRLTAWLRKLPSQGSDTIELWAAGLAPEKLAQWDAEAADTNARELAHVLIDQAQDHAEAVGEASGFKVVHKRDNSQLGQISFRREAGGAHGAYVGSPQEMVAQALAHNQSLTEMHRGVTGEMYRLMERELARAHERIRYLEEREQETLRLYAEAVRMTAQVEASAEEQVAREQRAAMLTEKAGRVVDLVLAKAAMESAKGG